VVPFGQLVPASCSTITCEPLIAALVQQPWMVPSLPTGPAAMAAPAAVPPATNARAAAPVMTILLAFMLASP
jgi:hypothetical protein